MVKSHNGIWLNDKCQICEHRDRKHAIHYFGGNFSTIWFLCPECVKHPSKFSIEHGNNDLTGKYPLDQICLRDARSEREPGMFRSCNQAFLFKMFYLHSDHFEVCMYLPYQGGYDWYTAMDMTTRQQVKLHSDVRIEIIPWVQDFPKAVPGGIWKVQPWP